MSLLEKVLGWLQANSAQCLSADQISDFFEVSRAKVATLLSQAVREGKLGFDDAAGEDSEPVWYLPKSDWAFEHGKCRERAADKRLKADPSVKPQNTPAMLMNAFMPLTKPRYTTRDFSALKIEDDVPIDSPVPRAEAQYVQLVKTFESMKPTQSVLIPQCNAVRHACAEFNKVAGQRVVTRKVDAEHTRVWRTE